MIIPRELAWRIPRWMTGACLCSLLIGLWAKSDLFIFFTFVGLLFMFLCNHNENPRTEDIENYRQVLIKRPRRERTKRKNKREEKYVREIG